MGCPRDLSNTVKSFPCIQKAQLLYFIKIQFINFNLSYTLKIIHSIIMSSHFRSSLSHQHQSLILRQMSQARIHIQRLVRNQFLTFVLFPSPSISFPFAISSTTAAAHPPSYSQQTIKPTRTQEIIATWQLMIFWQYICLMPLFTRQLVHVGLHLTILVGCIMDLKNHMVLIPTFNLQIIMKLNDQTLTN